MKLCLYARRVRIYYFAEITLNLEKYIDGELVSRTSLLELMHGYLNVSNMLQSCMDPKDQDRHRPIYGLSQSEEALCA